MRKLFAVLILAGLAVACSMARVSTKEVQEDGSYLQRGAWSFGIVTNTTDGFVSEWIDQSSTGSIFTDRMGWDSEREVDRETLIRILDMAAKLAASGAAL